MVAYLTSKVYPDNFFSIGAVPQKKKRAQDKYYDRDYSEQFNSCVKINKHYSGTQYDKISWLEGQIDPHNRFISSLQSSQSTIRYGSKGITKKGKRTVKAASAYLQKKWGKARLGFATLTIPNYSRSQIKILALNWSHVVRIFFQKLKREFAKVGIANHIIGVSEIQSKRYETDGIVAPHIHFVYVARNRSKSKFYIPADRFRQLWKEVIINEVGRWNDVSQRPVTWGASVDCQIIKKNVSSYLSKYLSKGGEVIEQINDDGRTSELPRTWWTISKVLREEYKRSIKNLSQDFLAQLFYETERFLEGGVIRWYGTVYIESNGTDRLVGVVGYFKNDAMAKLCTEVS